MNFDKLTSLANLQLAWRRITSGLNTNYKSRYGLIFEAYELGVPATLKDLRARLIAQTYQPTQPLRLYYPKSSGLQRPFTFLSVEDQIVLQAFANLCANKIRSDRQPLEGKNVFSNYLESPTSPFFVKEWWIGYRALKYKIETLYKDGFTWAVTFDLAAFYDTISHDLLIKIISPRSGDQKLGDKVRTWLKAWSSTTKGLGYSHGIPQGPVASAVLAECLMFPIDQKMSSEYNYLRYVDDIRIFGKSEGEIRHAMVKLDRLCRERGLIPQVDKLGIIKLSSPKDLDKLITPFDTYSQGTRRIPMAETRAFKMLASAIDSNGKKILDKTSLRFAIFRAPSSDRILKLILRLWLRFPEHTDAYATYLESYAGNATAPVRLAKKAVRMNYPYDSVKGEMWRILARMASPAEIKALCQDAIDAFKNSKTQPATQIGTLVFLCAAERAGLGNYSSFLNWNSSPMIQAFTAPFLPLVSPCGLATVGHMLRRSAPDAGLALTRSFHINSIDPEKILLPKETLNPILRAVYEKASVIPSTKRARHDAIGTTLSKRYGVSNWIKWRRLLNAEYAHANQTLVWANTYFDAYPSLWLAHQDAFNEIVFRALQEALAAAMAPGAIATTERSGKLIDYGKLVSDHCFAAAHPNLSKNLQDVHRRRNRLPSSHPYDKVSGARAIPLSSRERKPLLKKLSQAYDEIITICTSIGI